MNVINRDAAISAIQALRDLHDETALFLKKHDHQPLTDSTAFLELQTFERPESLWTAYSQGRMSIEVAADQLMAFSKTVTEPIQTIAPWTCTRAILESCALATWLLDPNIKARDRVKRSIAFRYEGLSQEVNFLRAASNESDVAKITKRIDELERTALSLGFSKIVGKKKGAPIGIAMKMPSITDIITQTLKEEATYRLLSAIAHAHPWALIQLGFQRINDEDINLLKSPDYIHFLEKTLKPESIVLLCTTTANSFVKPILCQSKLFGWEVDDLHDIINAAFARINT